MCKNDAKGRVKQKVSKLSKLVSATFTDKDYLINQTKVIFIKGYLADGGERPQLELQEELALASDLHVKTHENIERQQIRIRSREEWEEIEKTFIPPIPNHVPDNHRVCACWNCNNVFKKSGKKKYCSSDCTREQMDANSRFVATGTYLAPKRDGYLPNREENTGVKDKKRVVYTEDIEKAQIYGMRRKDGNRTFSPKRNPDKPASKVPLKLGIRDSCNQERQQTYEAFKKGKHPGTFTINIKTGLKIYHTNEKKHEYSEEGSSVGARHLSRNLIPGLM
ncbi:hypothetical protein [Bacillus sp. JJ722]|uniref:hypothetical protein n=1 Tax=Bacillus sp. JJ722 TaxID=3122973 RepID=UPI002FFD75A2